MKRFSLLHPLFLSFYSKPLYRDAAWNKKGFCLLYLFILLALTWAPVAVQVQINMNRFAKDKAPKIIAQLPKIQIKNGIASTEEARPYLIKDPDTDKPLILLDTSLSDAPPSDSTAPIALTKTQLAIQRGTVEERTMDFSQIKDWSANQDDYRWMVEVFRAWFAIFLYPFALFGSFLFRVLLASLYGMMGLLFAGAFRIELDYRASVRLSVIAFTPPIMLDTIKILSGLSLDYWGPICFLIATGYLVYGLKAIGEGDGGDQRAGSSGTPISP